MARRLEEFPRCTAALRGGRLSLDQVGVIAERAADGSDAHYAQLAESATVTQLRTAVKLEPRPEPKPRSEPKRSLTQTSDEQSLLSDADRQYLTCDATCEVWFERDGRPVGAGRQTRTVNRRLRRALEHRDRGTCVVPGCGATRGLHAHHLKHWEDGGPTELDNLVLLCPYHHRLHHRGCITITGPAERLSVTDAHGRRLTNASLARPPTAPPPEVPPCPGPTGERPNWWWYEPFRPGATHLQLITCL